MSFSGADGLANIAPRFDPVGLVGDVTLRFVPVGLVTDVVRSLMPLGWS